MDWDVVWSVVANICAFHHYMENGLGQRGMLKYICEVIFMIEAVVSASCIISQ
jgi:hypothetical protein